MTSAGSSSVQMHFSVRCEYFRRETAGREIPQQTKRPCRYCMNRGARLIKNPTCGFSAAGKMEVPIILYKYSETRAGDNAVEFLQGFKGYLMCDGYSGYNKVPDAKRTACWAHIRRYLVDAVPKGKNLDYSQPAVQGILYVDRLFRLEETIKAKSTTFDSLKKARLEKEVPVIEVFLSWLDLQKPIRGSRMDKAVTYIQNRRTYLQYLEIVDTFSNNLSECVCVTVSRKAAVLRCSRQCRPVPLCIPW